MSGKHAYREGFFFQFWVDTCPFLGPLIPLFRTSGEIYSRFQSQNGQPYLHFLTEVYIVGVYGQYSSWSLSPDACSAEVGCQT